MTGPNPLVPIILDGWGWRRAARGHPRPMSARFLGLKALSYRGELATKVGA